MRVEVDQSGKIEGYVNTVVAFRNGEQYSVFFKRKDKNYFLVHYRSKDIIYRLFAICVYFCVKPYLDKIQQIVIDIEYYGREKDIKKHLLSYILKDIPHFNKERIIFDRIGKKSRAHRLAYQTFCGKLAPNKILKFEEVDNLIKGT